MKPFQRILLFLLAFSLLFLFGCAPEADGKDMESEETSSSGKDMSAPDFTVYDREGNAVRLSDFEGKPVVLNFWASWCPPCRSEMPDFDKTYRSLGNEIHFVMVNLTDGQSETVESACAFLEDAGYSFPVYFDTGGMAAATYGISSIPTTYFINARGELVTWASGAISEALLLQGIDMIR